MGQPGYRRSRPGRWHDEETSATFIHRPISQFLLRVAVLAVPLLLALPAAASAAPRLEGVMLHSLWWDSSAADMDRELDLARDAGASAVRVDVQWSSLETGGKGARSGWYLDKLDRFMAGAERRGMKVIAMLWSTPCWASTAPETLRQGCAGAWWERGVDSYPPRNASDYADVAAFVAGRYGSTLAALEVWNEPNLSEGTFWKAPNKPAAYAALLRAAYPAVKAADPDVAVLAGALAFADRPFLEALYAEGIQGSYDGISLHPYNEWRHPGDRWREEWRKYAFVPGLEWIRAAQERVGDRTPLWITEFGWTACRDGGWCVSEAQQAEYIRAAFHILGGLDFVEAAIVYNLRDKGTDGGKESNWGVVRRDFSPKPSYAALAAALRGEPFAPAPLRPASAAPRAGSSPPRAARGMRRWTRPTRHRPVRLRMRRRHGVVFATGSGPARRRLRLRISRCPARRAMWVRVSHAGRFRRRLGRVAQLRRCWVSVRLPVRSARPDRRTRAAARGRVTRPL
jgi:polysaccharide biosynthesis protein PslG